MGLSSFEFSLRLFLPIYSVTTVIHRYGIFTALEEDVLIIYWNENYFCISTGVCNLQEVFHGRDSIDYSSSGSAMGLTSFELGLCLFLPIYSVTTVIDRYGIFTALEEDVYELGLMSKFFTGMKMIFASVLQHAIYKKSSTEFIKNRSRKIIGQIGHECSLFVLL